MTDKLTATMQIAKRVYSLAQEQNDSALMIGAYQRFGSHALSIWAISRPRNNTRCVVFRFGAREAYSLMRRGRLRRPSLVCAMRPYPSGISERVASCQATMAEAISLAKELNDMHRISRGAINWSRILAQFERNPAEVERLASELIELSTRHNFATLAAWSRHSPRLGAQRFR